MRYGKLSGRAETRRGKTASGRWVAPAPEDRTRYPGEVYTPARLKTIFDAANSGETERLCICGREILERNWDVIGALDQRSDALCGTPWEVLPGGTGPRDAEAAEAFRRVLENAGSAGGGMDRAETFDEFIRNMTDAVVQPFAASEIIWTEGGGIEGFRTVEPHHFTLRDGFVPRLRCDEFPFGMELPEYKFVLHQFRRRPDPARCGKIRVLAWLHCLQNWPLKDLFSFIERFGMPFVVAKVSQQSWDNDREVLKSIIRNFGPDGGGVFNTSTDIQLLNAANTGSDNVYFRALEFTHNAIYTLLVGQLASSGDSSGMSNGSAQTAVRQDILESDARSLESTVRAQIAAPWTRFQYGDGVAVPQMHFQTEPAEDQMLLAGVVNTLSQAGFKADEAELSKRFNLKLRYEPISAPESVKLSEDAVSMSAEEPPGGLSAALEEWLGPLADGIAAAAEMPDEELDRKLRSGEIARPGDSGAMEKLTGQMMEKEYRHAFTDKISGE